MSVGPSTGHGNLPVVTSSKNNDDHSLSNCQSTIATQQGVGTTNHLPHAFWDFWQGWYWPDLLQTTTVTLSAWLMVIFRGQHFTQSTPSFSLIFSLSLRWWCSLSLTGREINIDVSFRTEHSVSYSQQFEKLCISLLTTAYYKETICWPVLRPV